MKINKEKNKEENNEKDVYRYDRQNFIDRPYDSASSAATLVSHFK